MLRFFHNVFFSINIRAGKNNTRLCFGKPGRLWFSALLFLVVCFFGPSPSYCLNLSLSGDRITLDAQKVPLTSILQEFIRQGIRVQADPGINPQITASFEKQDLRLALDSIIHPFSYALIWSSEKSAVGGHSTLKELQIFKPGDKKNMHYLPAADDGLAIMMNPETGNRYVRAEVLIWVNKTIDPAGFRKLLDEMQGTVLEENAQQGLYRIKVPETTDIPSLVKRINATGRVGAEPNFIYTATPDYQLSSMPTTEQQSETSAEAHIGNAAVGILDSGLISGLGVDPFVVTALDSLNPDKPISDSMGHGTQMAMIATGMIRPDGAPGDSAETFVPVIPVKIFDDQGLSTTYSLIQSVDFVLNNNARVISLSWGTEASSAFLEQTMEQASASGAVILAAAGNQPTGKAMYPAAYDTVIGVGALMADGHRWENSNYGSFVSLYAPGVATFPVGNQGAAGTYVGTSISTAYVAGSVANFLNEYPQATKADIYKYLGISQ